MLQDRSYKNTTQKQLCYIDKNKQKLSSSEKKTWTHTVTQFVNLNYRNETMTVK